MRGVIKTVIIQLYMYCTCIYNAENVTHFPDSHQLSYVMFVSPHQQSTPRPSFSRLVCVGCILSVNTDFLIHTSHSQFPVLHMKESVY